MIRAVVFDLDGTLVDTEGLHFSGFKEVMEGEGILVDRDDYYRRLIGYNDRECISVLLKENGRHTDEVSVGRLMEEKAAAYLKLISSRTDLLYPGAADFVRLCSERFPLIIATGALRAEAELLMERAGLRDLFVDIISADDVQKSKPEPDIFIAALGRLGFRLRLRPPIAAEECLVVEDTPAGVEAARRAKMRVLAVAQTTPASTLGAADLVRNSLAETGLDSLLRELESREASPQ